jgi:hypothetical protein
MLTVIDIRLAIVQKAGRNLKGHLLGFGSGEAAEAIVGGTGGVFTGLRGGFEPLRAGSLARIDSSTSPEINFFILLDSFGSEVGVVIRPPQWIGSAGFPSLRWNQNNHEIDKGRIATYLQS